MPDVRTVTESAFAEIVANLEAEIGIADGEVQVIADDWTLVLEGDPVSSALIAVDDESLAPGQILDEVLPDRHLAALQSLNRELGGSLSVALAASPDPLAKELASRIG